MQITKFKDLVTTTLKHLPETRDNDNLLIAWVWNSQLLGMGYTGSRDFMSILKLKELAKPESITRCRRRLQEEFKELRGEVYENRHLEEIPTIEDIYTIQGEKNGN